jgi:hypothetical protein
MAKAGVTVWAGRVISALPLLLFAFGIVFGLTQQQAMRDGMAKMGWPADMGWYIVGLEAVSALLYAIPKTSVLGAVMLTGYLGGAIATHLRIHDPMVVMPAIVALVVWLGIYLREPRLRKILPFR